MKKIIKNILVLSLLIIAFYSCNDDRLEVLPEDYQIMDKAIKSEEDLDKAKNGIYSSLSSYNALGRDIIVIGDLISDNSFVSIENTNRFLVTNAMSYEGANTDLGTSAIRNLYSAINHANLVVNNTSVPETDFVKNVKAEAYAGRALSLFYAVNLYSASVNSGLYPDYGVPIPLGDYDANEKLPRATISEVYNQIEKDLLTSISLFTADSGQKGLITPLGAKLLLSRVYLYQKKWQKAYDLVNEIESNHPGYDFIDKSNYVDYFGSKNHLETVFELVYTTSTSLGPNSLYSLYGKNGAYKQNLFRQGVIDLFDNSDIRKSMFEKDLSSANTPSGWYTTKYKGNVQNVVILRMSEVKLNKIESLYHLGNESQALSELNAFAATRGSHNYSSSGDALLQDILKERRLEFVGEGYRFFDLKRNMLPIHKITNCFILTCSVVPTSRLFVLPMPLGELDYNPLMKQYPEY